ncbi:hypothetical protein KEM55_006539 [Ascosphaera atra]|nr:hypothetical protein KEM55_006539 [Ascosphaera atra]
MPPKGTNKQVTLGRFFGSNADRTATASPASSQPSKRRGSPPKKESESSDSDLQPTKRRRRTRKSAEAGAEDTAMTETKAATEPAATTSPKKRRGRPRKSTSPAPSPSSHEQTPEAAKSSSPAIETMTINDTTGKESDVAMTESEAESLEDAKPELARKTREKVQQKLKGSGKDAYPDWEPGTPVPYAALCTTFSLVEMTTKRLAILEYCSLFLRQVLRLTPEDLLSTVQLMINKLAADYAGIELGIGESLIMKAIGESTGRSLAVIKTDQQEIGDLGLVAAKSRSKQPTMFKPKPLTVRGVHAELLQIAQVQGQGAQDRKIGGIKRLLVLSSVHWRDIRRPLQSRGQVRLWV